jgi:AraC-like DNA-binding protein
MSAVLIIIRFREQNRPKHRLNWLAGILTGMLILWISVFVGFYTELISFFFVINIITIFILLEKKSIIRFNDHSKMNNFSVDNNESKRILAMLKRSMDDDKLYLDPDLTLPVLSGKTGIPLHTISKVINDKLNRNFSEFINNYRIAEAQNRLTDKRFSHYSIAAIAYDCGFNSLSVFNTSFKKIVSLTPSQYRRVNSIPNYVNN